MHVARWSAVDFRSSLFWLAVYPGVFVCGHPPSGMSVTVSLLPLLG